MGKKFNSEINSSIEAINNIDSSEREQDINKKLQDTKKTLMKSIQDQIDELIKTKSDKVLV